ncbi:MAG: CapA family protein [Bacteroidetes bacterium]|nr:MAG: CapA family protein [Bacteroidota bacterium]
MSSRLRILFFTIGLFTISALFAQSDSLPKTIRFAAVGDIMLGTNFPDAGYLPPHDGKYLLDSVKGFIDSADIAFGNLEGTYYDVPGNTTKRCKDPKKCYAFRSPEHYLNYVQEAGFDLVSLANNHSGDFGPEARKRTMELSDSLGLTYAGLLDCPWAVLEKDSIRYGFAAFAPNSGCMQLNDMETALGIVKHLDSISDIIVISFHGGAEGSKHQHVPAGREVFLGENRGNLREFTHALVDAGADLIFGHGPHVTRGIELYNDRLIAYSLGNFATYARFNLLGPNGICPILLVDTDSSGRFVEGQIIPVEQLGEGIPQVDQRGRVIQKMRELSTTDFPKSPLVISEEGFIRRKD